MIQLNGHQARALFDVADGAAVLVLRAGGTTAPYPVTVEVRNASGRKVNSGVLQLSGSYHRHERASA